MITNENAFNFGMFLIFYQEKIVKMKLPISSKELYSEYKKQMRKIADVKNASAVLQWDQETYLPVKGATFRGQQIFGARRVLLVEAPLDDAGFFEAL